MYSYGRVSVPSHTYLDIRCYTLDAEGINAFRVSDAIRREQAPAVRYFIEFLAAKNPNLFFYSPFTLRFFETLFLRTAGAVYRAVRAAATAGGFPFFVFFYHTYDNCRNDSNQNSADNNRCNILA